MKKPLLLALDLGSSSVRSALFTSRGARILSSTAARKYSVRYTADGGAELLPNELLRATALCLRQTLRTPGSIVAISGSAFWHSLLGLDQHDRPITPIYTWGDSRAGFDAAEMRRVLTEEEILQRTGCMLRAPFWPAKLRWLGRTDRALFRKTRRWLSPAAWIFEELFGVALTSHSMASGTGLYDLRAGSWDAELCRRCQVRAEQLGPVGDRGLTSDGIACFSAIGDGAAGNLGSGAASRNQIAINIGTSAAVRMLVPKSARTKIPFGLFQYVVDQERAVLGGAISNAGNLHQWCLRELRLTPLDAEQTLLQSDAARGRLTVLPFFVQERSPTWPADLGGVIVGLNPSTTAADILWAATTSTYYRLADLLDLLKPPARAEIIVSGGVLHSPASLKMLADCLGRDLRVCRELESSLRGAAIYALENLGYPAKPLAPGKIVRHRPKLTELHRTRRLRQQELERLFTR